ncbi:MAG TPA: hypothetical protein VH349_17300 [Ktedonobacterales bacterium]|jgi:hypothetical protein
MAYQITLSDDDYAALQAASKRTGEPVEALLHAAIARALNTQQQTIGSYQYPTGEPDTLEEEAEDERLAQSITPGSPTLSEMVIEDRGPR